MSSASVAARHSHRCLAAHSERDMYLKLGRAVLGVMRLLLVEDDDGRVRVEFAHRYPLFLYSHLSNVIQSSVK